MNKNTILSIALICSLIINVLLLWTHNSPLARTGKSLIYSVIYRDRIKRMFEDNMDLINNVLRICEENSSENISDEKLQEAIDKIGYNMMGYNTLILYKNPAFKNEGLARNDMPFAFENTFGRDWDGTTTKQWMQLIYVLDSKYQNNPKAKIYAIAKEIILQSISIDTKELYQHAVEMERYNNLQQHLKSQSK